MRADWFCFSVVSVIKHWKVQQYMCFFLLFTDLEEITLISCK